MTMTLPASTPAPASSASLDPILRVIVAIVGAIEGLGGLTDLSILLNDMSTIPGTSPGGVIIIASIILHPILGFAALGLALARRLRYGITALALLVLTQWCSDMPSVINHGIGLTGNAFVVTMTVLKILVQPALALLAIAAAWFNRHLALAAVAVMLPTIVDAASVAAFAVGVFIHGF